MTLSGCADKIEYHFGGTVCEQGVVTAMNETTAKAVFPKGETGSVLISRSCYESKIIRATSESIEKLNK